MMRDVSSKTHFHHLLVFFASFICHFLAGQSDHSANPKDGTAYDSHSVSQGKNGSNVVVVLILVVVAVLLSLLLFKFWQKKKREEQHARLLKLFEEDDELELELGLRD